MSISVQGFGTPFASAGFKGGGGGGLVWFLFRNAGRALGEDCPGCCGAFGGRCCSGWWSPCHRGVGSRYGGQRVGVCGGGWSSIRWGG